MNASILTITIDQELDNQLSRLAGLLGMSRTDLVQQAINRQISLLLFDETRTKVMPFAEAQGYLSDEDVFRDVS